MRRQSTPIYATVGSICAILMIASAVAQDDRITPTKNPQEPTNTKAANEKNQDPKKTFEQIVAEVRENEKKINQLFSSIPVGFPKRQIEHLGRINALKKSTQALKIQLESAAITAYQLDPKKNRFAAKLVFSTLVHKLEITTVNPAYDPQGALEIAEMLLETDLEGEPLGPLRLEDVAYQAFLASYAIEDFARADLMLKKIEDKGIALQETMRAELTDAQEKWQKELMIRRLESNTDDLPRVKLETSEGDIVVELFENHAPQTVGNFVSLVEKHFYDGLPFFLVKPSQIAQTGCPDGDGSGDAGYQIPCECYREQIRHHFTGTLSMSNSGRDSGGSQFFITHQRDGQFDGKFTAFGRVIEGLDVVYRLKIADGTISNVATPRATDPSTIVKATVIRKRDHPYTPTRAAKKLENNLDRSVPD